MTVGDATVSATFSDAITSCGVYARHMEPCPPSLVLPHLFSEPFRLHLVTTKPFRQLGFSRGSNAGTGHTPASLLVSKRLVTATVQERQRHKRQCILPAPDRARGKCSPMGSSAVCPIYVGLPAHRGAASLNPQTIQAIINITPDIQLECSSYSVGAQGQSDMICPTNLAPRMCVVTVTLSRNNSGPSSASTAVGMMAQILLRLEDSRRVGR